MFYSDETSTPFNCTTENGSCSMNIYCQYTLSNWTITVSNIATNDDTPFNLTTTAHYINSTTLTTTPHIVSFNTSDNFEDEYAFFLLDWQEFNQTQYQTLTISVFPVPGTRKIRIQLFEL